MNSALYRVFLQVVGGLGLALGQPARFACLGLLASCVCFAMHWNALQSLNRKQIRWISFSWFFVVQLVQLSWMSSIEYQGIYILWVYLGLAAAMGAQFSFLTGRLLRQERLDWMFVLGICSLWTLLEWGRLHVLCGCAFNFVGLFLSWNVISLQMASLFGILGMSFWVIFTNILALKAWRFRCFSHYLVWGFAILLPFAYGVSHIAYHDAKKKVQKEETCSALLVQTGLLPSQKYLLANRRKDFIPLVKQWDQILRQIALYKAEKIDLLVLPEAAVPLGLQTCGLDLAWVEKEFLLVFGEESLSSFPKKDVCLEGKQGKTWVSNAYILQTLANYLQAEIIAGLDLCEGERNYNSAVFFAPDQNTQLRYDKRVLLPLAEYMPFKGLQFLSRYYGIEEFFTPGKEAVVLGNFCVAPSICYDELFPSLLREAKAKKAKLFVNITNDGWYPHSCLPQQHFTHGLMRSIENGLPSIRACNTGVTAAVDSLGRIVSRLDADFGSLLVNVPLYQYKTLYSLWGDVPLLAFCFVLSFCLFRKNFRGECKILL